MGPRPFQCDTGILTSYCPTRLIFRWIWMNGKNGMYTGCRPRSTAGMGRTSSAASCTVTEGEHPLPCNRGPNHAGWQAERILLYRRGCQDEQAPGLLCKRNGNTWLKERQRGSKRETKEHQACLCRFKTGHPYPEAQARGTGERLPGTGRKTQ